MDRVHELVWNERGAESIELHARDAVRRRRRAHRRPCERRARGGGFMLASSGGPVKLYDSKLAPNPRRVRIFLAEKGISVPTIQVDIGPVRENRKPPYIEKNPLGGTPMLELDDGTCIAESVAICRYFEETHPNPPLMGGDATDRAVVEMWQRRVELEVFRNVTATFQNTHDFFKGRIEQVPAYGEVARKAARARLAWLDAELANRPFVAGDR